ncbi:MAG: peptide chain release factor family protein [Planctomycetota bacterium]
MSHPTALSDDDLLALCEVRRTRGSGPGGRHRNSTESRVVIRHTESGIEGRAGERRSQHENLAVAIRRLRLALATEIRAEPTTPSQLWQARTRGGRIECNPEHRDYPVLLADALNLIAAEGWEVKPAAERLALSPTQLIRLVALHPPALAVVNRERTARSLSALHG